ncbi:uncharacterized protein B0H18DRAFT_175219 [Fomitopsis serialis]|uniref:uncharacterized protein n=1 Tax=Fomitopsis serialis TaxID=139415 RepID=UPI002008D0CE|nr:uncharacterized protein B0H18DRAFT_175219 [Neoantrodia serialis]KAH9929812.1 hypothetical protein B0H18DRAFT_175219 [Neoantrodia serialis]
MEFELINAEPAMRSPRSEPMQRSPQPSQSSISMFNTISATNSSNPTLISRLPTPPLSSRSAAGPSSLPDATQTSQSDGMENLNSSTANGSGPGRSQVDETDPIHTFLNQLKRPLAHLTDAFRDFGVVKGEDLDVLCELKDQWTFLQACLGDAKKVTPLEWMIIKAGLEGRAARLRK